MAGKANNERTFELVVRGLVQGIGFRPFVYRLATAYNLSGRVENRNDGVVIELRGTPDQIRAFRQNLVTQAPEASSIESVEVREAKENYFSGFEIGSSGDVSSVVTEISPDIAVCDQCLADMSVQPARTDYPLINCTHCGPRFTIIKDLPYDRSRTTMAPFIMCPECRSEYGDVTDRRFHAQPVACHRCGPEYLLETPAGESRGIARILERVTELIASGEVLAVKGTGGFHLVCDAFSREGVGRLRDIKKRDAKPFAVMFRDTDAARRYVKIDEAGERSLCSWRRPIVLLDRRGGFTPGIADGLSTLGVMLPYMPFHHLLFRELDTPALVTTSGNLSGEPIAISDAEAGRIFRDHVAGIVTYNREIHNRVDDSVVTVLENQPVVLRRARGYVPAPIRTGMELEGIFAAGAELTSSFCLGKGNQAIMNQYTGDLKNLETLEFYTESYRRFSRLFRFDPGLVVCDLHPDYLSTRFAEQLAGESGIPLLKVQHHHAHIASAMLEAGLEGEVIGFGFDGTGLGSDGLPWGAEVLRAGYRDFRRVFHFENMPLPGGDKAAGEPWRMALSYLDRAYGSRLDGMPMPFREKIPEEETEKVLEMIRKGIHAPPASSAGRLFDAVAALTGLCFYNSYQAEAPMKLESALDPTERGSYRFGINENTISFTEMVRQIVGEMQRGIPAGRIAARFHNTIVDLVVHLAGRIREETGLDRVVLGGGTFQNRYLVKKIRDKLENQRFAVYLPRAVPVNDQGIAAGQLAIGARYLFDGDMEV